MNRKLDTRPRIYLGLDGEIYPTTPLNEADTRGLEIDSSSNLEWWRVDIAKRIGSLGAEITIASERALWFVNNQTTNSPLRLLHPERALSIDQYQSIEEAVTRDLKIAPTPFVWVDHNMNESLAKAAREATDQPGEFIKPDGTTGLTDEDVDKMAKFLESLRG